MLSTIFASLALFFSIVATLLCVRYAIFCKKMGKYVYTRNKASVTLKKLTEIESELTDHADSIASLHTSLKKLRARVGMRHMRELRKNGSDIPDSKEDPEGYKAYIRKTVLRRT